MSAYKVVRCDIVDKQTLLEALDNLGLQYVVNDSPQHLEGYENSLRKQTAEIIVSRHNLNNCFTGASNDLGFKWNEDERKYDMIISDYDVDNNIGKRIMQSYAEVAITKALATNKFNINKISGNLKSRTRNNVNIVATRII